MSKQDAANTIWPVERRILNHIAKRKGYKMKPYGQKAPPVHNLTTLLDMIDITELKKAKPGQIMKYRKKYEHTHGFPESGNVRRRKPEKYSIPWLNQESRKRRRAAKKSKVPQFNTRKKSVTSLYPGQPWSSRRKNRNAPQPQPEPQPTPSTRPPRRLASLRPKML